MSAASAREARSVARRPASRWRLLAWLLAGPWLQAGAQADAIETARGTRSAPAAAAKRIVSLAPHITELAYAAGAGGRLVATVEYSDFPASARTLPRIGDAFRIDLEQLLALRPDLVLSWQDGTPAAVLERLDALGLRHEAVSAVRLDDIATAMERIGTLAATTGYASRAAADYRRRLAELRAAHAGRTPRSVFIEVDDRPLYTVSGRHLISEVVALCGGRNVFGELRQLAPQVTLEAVLARDPEVILSLDDTVADPLAEWARWPQLRAVRDRAVHSLPSDLLTRATPRILDGIARDPTG
jgi:iron complex transport system substrate-binding protein